MIARDFITEWREHAPWSADRQVEQDLVICRALVELFSHPQIAASLAFRGGTALYKLHCQPAARYSEDIDLVQVDPGGIGPVLDAIHDRLDGWLGSPRYKQKDGRVTLTYRFLSEELPAIELKLKVEINTREHFNLYGLCPHRFEVRSRWFSAATEIPTYGLDELLGTKLRALYERRKGRDLFDLALGLRRRDVAVDRILEAFTRYVTISGRAITRAMFEKNLLDKRAHTGFRADMERLLPGAHGSSWSFDDDFDLVWRELVARLP